ncbi:HicB family protein [Kaistia sp. 32K]|uniref:type II toxin-antitoxin system HicB family antitoxin n=1 Tax=Kaistia sp. 32K TaxID=2795690 RepID=UPI0019163DE8|nr:type II toxin-antitoxin system HicB family antitoxin [Kaistia sp. 32K]BCP51420.1 HicB family protein [Kaistia sp. 32K]
MPRYVALVDGEAGVYGVSFPDLPGCVAMGRTVDEALANAADALRDWINVTEEKAGVPPPRSLEAIRRDADTIEALREGASLAIVPLVRDTGRPAKANLSIDVGILEAIDEEAARRRLTRSAMVELMARRMLSELV